MDRVFATRTVKGIKSALASMPQKIDELYKLTLERIQKQAGDDGALAMRILSWITHARRPLSVNEFRHGLAAEYNDDEDKDLNATELDKDNLLQPESLVDVCAGLVIIDSASQIIRLVHYTTQEYFGNKLLDLFAGAEADISRACLTCLSYDIGHRFPNRNIAMSAFESHPFLHYASGHWFSHVHSSLSVANPAPEFLEFVARFKFSDSSLRSINLFRWVSQHGLYLYRSSPSPDMECPHRESALEIASYWGLEELVTVLLDHSTGSCPGLERPLVFASQAGAVNVVDLLLRYGAQVNLPVDVRSVFCVGETSTALGAACEQGSLPVAKVLIENGANPHVGDTPPMHAAILADQPIMVDFLLKEGTNVNATDSEKRTALQYAAFHNSVEAAKLLLDAHCDLDFIDDWGMTALHYAAGEVLIEGVDVVKCLLDAHCNLKLKDYKGMTALHHAACQVAEYGTDVGGYGTDVGGYGANVVRLLLDAHCDLNLKAENGRTALHFAAYSFALDILELLLDRGADASAKDKSGRTARNVLEFKLQSKEYYTRKDHYRLGERKKAERKKAERLVQRIVHLEITSSARSAKKA